MFDPKKTYDLEERSAKYAEDIVKLCKKVPKNVVTVPIIGQLIDAGTSQGANYCEANGASSKKDFRNKIFICKKETKESYYWLRMLSIACEELEEIVKECKRLYQEGIELAKIYSSIAVKSK